MTFQLAVREYLTSLGQEMENARRGGQHTDELSYRPVLNNFFRRLADLFGSEVVSVFEPRRQHRAGRPDWRFHHAANLGIYGYVEAKGLDIINELPIEDHREQINRYLSLGHRLIITDGIEFIFLFPGEPVQRLLLVQKHINPDEWSRHVASPLFEQRFRQFFLQTASRICSEDELITEVARRAVELSRNIRELSGLPVEAGRDATEANTIRVLNDLKSLVENHHDSRLRNEKAFSDFVAQVLVFGLLYAHRVVIDPGSSPAMRRDRIVQYWSEVVYGDTTERLRPFRALVRMLGDELDSLGALGTWYQDCLMFLSHIELQTEQVDDPDYHGLYERFLDVFDPSARFDFGAFYTPRELASYTVNFVNVIIDSVFPGTSLYLQNNKIIDPCCGTGTFLEQIIHRAGGNASLPNIIGFEILPAPYVLAHYRLYMLQGTEDNLENTEIVLTNTLSDDLEREPDHEQGNLIIAEQAFARKFARPPITLVIGNPPSSDSSREEDNTAFTIINSLIDDFRPPIDARRSRQNTQKQMRNLFVLFLRWACNKLLSSGNPAILAMILPHSFGESPSYRYARRFINDNFEKIWVLDIDLDGRTGVRSSSLFKTLQGRMLLVAVTGGAEFQLQDRNFFYHSITQMTKQEKTTYLASQPSDENLLREYVSLQPDVEQCVFRPQPEFNRALYEQFWPICPESNNPTEEERFIFERHCSGIKLAPSSLFVHVNRNMLMRRLRDISNNEISIEHVISDWYSQQQRPPTAEKVQAMRGSLNRVLSHTTIQNLSYRTYAYRPFLNMEIIFSEQVLSDMASVGGRGTRLRPEVISTFTNERAKGIAITFNPKDLGDRLHRFASFCWHMPDNDLSSRGNGRILSNIFPAYSRRRNRDLTPIDNINPVLVNRVSAMFQLDRLNAMDQILFYTYGVLCSDAYMDEFEGALFTVNTPEQRARIPIVADSGLLNSIAEKGRRLAELENLNLPADPVGRFENLAHLFEGPFNLTHYIINAEDELLELRGTNIDEQRIIRMTPIDSEILDFKVAGHSVIHQWLKHHTYRYMRNAFSEEHYVRLLDLFSRLARQLSIVQELDEDIHLILSGEAPLFTS